MSTEISPKKASSEINEAVRIQMEDAMRQTKDHSDKMEKARFEEMMLLEYSAIALTGLLSGGRDVSYDTAHSAFSMAKMMVEVRSQYILPKE
jgi:hypothetical protein